VPEVRGIDEETGTKLWKRALNKEMIYVEVTWKAEDSITPKLV
jgi:hypothetical protein